MIIRSAITALLIIAAFIPSCRTAEKKSGKIPVKPEKKEERIKDGPGKEFWDDGSIKGKGNFKNYLKEGNWILFYKGSGEKLAQGDYLNDKQQGIWTFYYKNGMKSTEGAFEDNQKTGKWKGYYDTGEEMWTAIYVIRDTEFGKAGLIEGTKTSYYRSGKVLTHEEYRNGVKKGKHQEFHENGKPREISWFTDDKHNGKSNTYWENGNPKEQGLYQDDLRNGEWKFFYDNNQLQMTGKFTISKLSIKGEEQLVSQMEGKWRFFSNNGLLQKEGEYVGGKEKGLWKFYSYNERKKGMLMMELSLKGGMAAGFGKIYENNALIGEGEMMGSVKGIYEKYINDKKAGEESFINIPPDNAVNLTYKWTGQWQVPLKNGKWTEYYPGGQNKRFETTYMMNKLNGAYKEYFKNGKIKSEGEYMNNKKNGIWRVYNENGSVNEEESGRWMMDKKLNI